LRPLEGALRGLCIDSSLGGVGGAYGVVTKHGHVLWGYIIFIARCSPESKACMECLFLSVGIGWRFRASISAKIWD
jgi:hypothetical protein